MIRPDIDTITTADQARDIAIEWSYVEIDDMGELLEWQAFFETLVERFPELRDEFVENGIC